MNSRREEVKKHFELYAGCCNQIKRAWPKAVVNEKNKWPRIELFDGAVSYGGRKRQMMLFADPSGRAGKWAFVLWTECDKPVIRAALQTYFARHSNGLDSRIKPEWQRGRDVNSNLGYVMKFRTNVSSWERGISWKRPHIATDNEIAELQDSYKHIIVELRNAGFSI